MIDLKLKNKERRGKHRTKRESVIKRLGGQCECCGERRIEFLAIDHINGGGSKHRKKMKGAHIEDWLIANNFPAGFRLLCHNCNSSKGFYGYCPHELEKTKKLKKN